MCGIAGLITHGPAPEPGLLGRMLGAMAHRGPDGFAEQLEQLGQGTHAALGHRRLAIIDLSAAAAQPMASGCGRFVITFNGEIYNHLELRAELEALGSRFRTRSDTEVILEAYARWGDACLERLNGMFALALLDRPRRRLFCARDRYGEKPFLYSRRQGLFAFASEFKALLLHPAIPLAHDEWRLVQAAADPSTGLDAERQTVFDAIEQLLPGECMALDLATLEVRHHRYWQPKVGSEAGLGDPREVFEAFGALLKDSVRLRLRSDVPVGSCLSGGLDSSAIVCIARGLLGAEADYQSFTGRFPGTDADEWTYAEQVVHAARTTSRIVEPTVDGFLDEAAAFTWNNELPVGSSSQYAQWCVFRLAREHGVTVLLDGQGADEQLGGYEQYFAPYLESLRARGAHERLTRESRAIRERYPRALSAPARAWRARLPFPLRRRVARALGMGSDILFGIQPPAASRLLAQRQTKVQRGAHALNRALAADAVGGYLLTLLRYGDRNSMAHSREVRLPFCDHRIAEFVLAQPPELLMGEVQTKLLLRESMRGVLPEGVRARWNKQGFRPPQQEWFAAPRMQAAVREAFASDAFRQSPHWDPPWWDRLLGRIERGEHALGWVAWQPYAIELWRRHFLERIAAGRAAGARG